VRREEPSKESSLGLPEGYRLEAGGGNLLVLRRSDGSAVASFAFSAFGPTPEAIREAAEEDYRKGRRRAQGGEDGEEGRGW
jgi:hypothetical protein